MGTVADLDDLTRADLPTDARAVADTLDEWLVRMHGIHSGGHFVGAFLDFLGERGYEVRPAPDPTAHDYLSTACHHGLHDRCRKVCKFCPTACRCVCHLIAEGVDRD